MRASDQGGECPAPHTPQQQQLYAVPYAAYPSGPPKYYLTENSFGPALRCPHCNAVLWKDSEGRFLQCSCTNTVPHAIPYSGPFLCECGNPAQFWVGDDVCGTVYCESCYPVKPSRPTSSAVPCLPHEMDAYGWYIPPRERNQYDRRACTVCGHPDSPSVIDVWYDTLRDRVCGDCFAWATAKMKTVKLQRMYT